MFLRVVILSAITARKPDVSAKTGCDDPIINSQDGSFASCTEECVGFQGKGLSKGSFLFFMKNIVKPLLKVGNSEGQ